MKEFPITAIVVLYHSKHLINSFINNIQSLITGLEEIILVDNSNEDLSEFENHLVKTIHPSENIGYGAAINLGVKKATNNIIVAMNPDIEITRWELPGDWISNNLIIASGIPSEWTSIRKFPSLLYDMTRLSVKNLARPFQWIHYLSGSISLENIVNPKQVDWVSGAMVISNKKTLRKLGGFDEKYFLFYEEIDLCQRATSLAIPCYIMPNIHFHLHSGTSSLSDVSDIKFISEIQSAKRYHLRYTNKYFCSVIFYCFKIYCFLIAHTLNIIHLIIPHDKIHKKAKQYYLYAKHA